MNYFDNFFQEKDVPFIQWDLVDSTGRAHIISNATIIEEIQHATKAEQSAIKKMLIKIDFINGNINDYLKHLAGALINQY